MNTLSTAALYRAFIIALFASLWHAPLSAATEPAPSARDVVVETSERLIAALQENREAIRQDLEKAYELAEATVMPHLDFTRITRWVLGKHWRAATAQQRQRLTDEFRILLTRSYVSAMVNYVDHILQHADNVQFPPSRSRQDDESAVVAMLISLESGQQATVLYQMYLSDTGWKVYDVQVEGISLALTYRSSFSQEIARDGIDGLIATLTERNRQSVREPLPTIAPAAP